MREAARSFGLTKTRLNEWDRALLADGSLSSLMKTLRSEPAGSLAWRSCGRPSYGRNKALAAAVLEIKLADFRLAFAAVA